MVLIFRYDLLEAATDAILGFFLTRNLLFFCRYLSSLTNITFKGLKAKKPRRLMHNCCAQEVVGSAIAISILSDGAIPLWAGTIIAVSVSFFLLFLDDVNHRMLEGLFGVLISTMALAFMVPGYITGGHALIGANISMSPLILPNIVQA